MTIGMWPVADGPQAETVLLLRSLEEFAGQLSALRDLVTVVSAHVTPLDEADFDRRIQRATLGSLEGLADPERERIARLAVIWLNALRDLPKDQFAAGLGLPVATADGHARFAAVQQAFAELIEAYPDIGHSGEFVLGFLEALTAMRRGEVLHRAIITGAVSAFEPLLRLLVTAATQRSHPESTAAQITETVARVLRGGYRRWDQWTTEHLGVSLLEQTDDRGALTEVFERRHLIVHNAAIADERYGRLTSAPAPIGTEVLTNGEYVLPALDLLAVAGLRLAFTGWTALFPNLTHNASLMTLHVVRRHLLDKSAWRASVAMCSFLAERCDSVPTRGVGQVHYWYARKQLDGLESIRTDMETWVPPSADFALARLALLDRRHEALALARELLATGALTRIDMRASPVLAWLVAELDGDAADVSAPAPA